MNRGTRRHSRRHRSRGAKAATVLLVGGPMAGWHVTEDAAPLKPDWPPPTEWIGRLGRCGPVFTADDGSHRAEWIPGEPR